jgi:hypothetical protein
MKESISFFEGKCEQFPHSSDQYFWFYIQEDKLHIAVIYMGIKP